MRSFPLQEVAAAAVYQEHGEQMAKELYEVIRDKLAPLYDDAQSDRFREVMERDYLKAVDATLGAIRKMAAGQPV